MSYTLTTAVAQVRSTLNEDTATFWTDGELEGWIEEGTILFSTISLCVEADDTITLIENQINYSSSDSGCDWIDDVIEVYSGYYDDQSNGYAGLVKAHPRMLGHLATFTPGDPKYVMFHNKKIYIWPLTTAALVTAGATVQVLYSKSTSDITDLPEHFQLYPIIYATGKAKQKDRREAEAASLFAQFFSMANFERADKYVREPDTYDSFQIPQGGAQRGQ